MLLLRLNYIRHSYVIGLWVFPMNYLGPQQFHNKPKKCLTLKCTHFSSGESAPPDPSMVRAPTTTVRQSCEALCLIMLQVQGVDSWSPYKRWNESSAQADPYASLDILRLTHRQHLNPCGKSTGVMETVCATGELGTGVHNLAVISSGQSKAVCLDQSAEGYRGA